MNGSDDASEEAPNNRVLVGEVEDGIACMLQLTYLPHLTFQGDGAPRSKGVRVDHRHRNHGVGSVLVRHAIQLAEAHGCHLVQLTTNKRRDRALRFYEALGFEATHEGMKLYLTGSVTSR